MDSGEGGRPGPAAAAFRPSGCAVPTPGCGRSGGGAAEQLLAAELHRTKPALRFRPGDCDLHTGRLIESPGLRWYVCGELESQDISHSL